MAAEESLMEEFIVRFFVGGLFVSCFAALADVLKPKSFAGLFGAAPSVALATLALTTLSDGPAYAAVEARSLMAAAVAFFVYACVISRLMMRFEWHAAKTTAMALAVWFAISFSLWRVFLR
jgi:hypothetical protein